MREQNFTPILIFSVTNKENKGTLAEEIAYSAVISRLNSAGIPFKKTLGVYNNEEPEKGFVVTNINAEHYDLVLSIAKEYKQESVFISDRFRNAYLMFLEIESTEKIGVLHNNGKVKPNKDYTLDVKTGNYFTVIDVAALTT